MRAKGRRPEATGASRGSEAGSRRRSPPVPRPRTSRRPTNSTARTRGTGHTSRRHVAAGASNRAAGGATLATPRGKRLDQAAVAVLQLEEAPRAAAVVVRWPSPGSYAREGFSRGSRQTRESTRAISRVLLQTCDWGQLITMGLRPLSSMDRAPDFGSGGCEFESCSGYQQPSLGLGRMAKPGVQ